MRPVFYWGLEYETSLLIHDKNGFNSKVVWQDDMVKLTSEVFDKDHTDMSTSHPGYWDNGKKSDRLNQRGMYIIESQIGVFSGFELTACYKNLNVLEQKLTEMIAHQCLIYDYTHLQSFPVFTYVSPSHEDDVDDTDYFLDYTLHIPGLYILNTTYFGYRAVNSSDNDRTGVPQLTCSFELKYVPVLLAVLANYTRLEENKKAYQTIIEYTHGLSIHDPDTHAFIMYLIDYYVMYLQYDPNDKENYFKSFFDIKPRTNPASLYAILSSDTRVQIQTIHDTLSIKPDPSDIDRYLVDIISHLQSTMCVYIGNPIHKKILPGLYTYDSDDVVLVDAIETNVNKYDIEDAPCVNMPDPLMKNIKQLPILTYDEESDRFKGGFPIDVWEWNVKQGLVTVELRDFNDLVHMSMLIMTEHGYESDCSIDGMDIDIPTFKHGLDLIFRFFFPTVFGLPIRPIRMRTHLRKSRLKRR